jgi:hypothetical protein
LGSEALENKRYFDNFSHINELNLYDGDYSDEDFVHLSKVQILFLSRYIYTREITGEGFRHLKNIKNISILYGSLSPNSLFHLKNVHEIKLCRVRNITNSSLSHLSNVKKVKIKEHWNYPLTLEGYKNLKNCVSLDVSDNDSITDEVIEHFSSMKNLKSLDVRYIEELSSSSVSKLKNLTTLKIGYNVELDNSFLEHLKNLKVFHANYFLTDEGMKYLGKIETLRIDDCERVTDESFKYLKSVKDLTLEFMDHLTPKVIKILSKERKVMEKVEMYNFFTPTNQYDWRSEMKIKNLII